MLFNYVSVPDKKQGRNACDAIPGSYFGSVVYIKLSHFDPAFIFLSNFLNSGCKHFAGAAPLRPEIHEDRQLRFERFRIII